METEVDMQRDVDRRGAKEAETSVKYTHLKTLTGTLMRLKTLEKKNIIRQFECVVSRAMFI